MHRILQRTLIQPGFGIVGQADRLRFVLAPAKRCHRPEGLLAGDLYRRSHVVLAGGPAEEPHIDEQ